MRESRSDVMYNGMIGAVFFLEAINQKAKVGGLSVLVSAYSLDIRP